MSDGKKNILVVDDDDMNANILKDRLEHEGFDVKRAKDGVEGIQFYKELKPDLILLDHVMPNADGLEVLKTIRGDVNDQTTPILMYTALGQEDVEKKALELGASSFFVKGREGPKELIDRVHSLIKD